MEDKESTLLELYKDYPSLDNATVYMIYNEESDRDERAARTILNALVESLDPSTNNYDHLTGNNMQSSFSEIGPEPKTIFNPLDQQYPPQE
jgi:hypothetical protein